MFVCGYNEYNNLGENPNNKNTGTPFNCPPCKSHFILSSLLSISIYSDHLVIINEKYEAYGIGDNTDGFISPTLPNEILHKENKIEFKDKNGQPFKFISAVCGKRYTLYQVTSNTKKDDGQLIFINENQQPIIVNIFGRTPTSLFGGFSTAAVIDTEGSVIFLTIDKLNRTKGDASPVKLPSGEPAVEVACCDEFVVVSDARGRLFESPIENGDITNLREVSELKNERIVCVTGRRYHCFAVCEDGRVFGKGVNNWGSLCLPRGSDSRDKFTHIESLSKYKIVSAFAGTSHSIFKTSTGKILGCGDNSFGQLLLNEPSDDDFYPPIELPSICSDPFFITGDGLTVFMSEKDVPPKTPNRKSNPAAKPEPKPKPKAATKPKISIQKSATSESTLSIKIEEQEATILRLEEEIKKLKKENDSLKKNETTYKHRITDLEEELKATKITKSKPEPKTSITQGGGFEILDAKFLSSLHRVKRIGRGGTSEVFEVSQERHYAQKFLLFEDEVAVEDMKHLIRDYEALVHINSPHIVCAYGMSFGTETETPSILLELCSCNLKKRVSELKDQERVQIICELSEGMRDVHRAGIIHGDLKLENILLDELNHVKVSDFGHSHVMNSMSSTSRSQIGGTLKFMAPELIQERTDYDEKIDVYAFGVVVYVIAMKGEFPKISIADVANGKKAKIPPSVTKFTSELINRCWSFKSSDRPSFEEICELLDGNEHKLI